MTIAVGFLALVATGCSGGETVASTTTTTVPFTTTSVAATTSTTTSTTTTTTVPPSLGATSTIFRVQQDLAALGFFDGQIDGIAGEETQKALKAFQTQQGLEADGEFGPKTDAALYPLLMKNKAYVESLQEDLTEAGLYTGPIDGSYGKGTKAAVEKLQESCDIEKTGNIDIATRICLDEAI
ncbi:MAG: peptidoglycan-binding protein [Acidimicrobiia bacterium]|nr:peptidoglycan-binding protein [Acidimicrobiia bacterium]